MTKYAVGECHWERRETADSGHDLIVDSVSLCEFISDTHSGTPLLEQAVEQRKLFIVLDLTNDKGPMPILSSGYIPGRLLTSSYDLMSKVERARNEIVGRALSAVLQSLVTQGAK